jgi:hypothetical protein
MKNNTARNYEKSHKLGAFTKGYGSVFSMFSSSDYERYIKNDNANLYKIWRKVGDDLRKSISSFGDKE